MKPAVLIREVGMRDGLQSIPSVVPTQIKQHILDALIHAGVRSFDAASFVPSKLLPQMADAAQVVNYLALQRDVEVAALVPNLKGMAFAQAAGAHVLLFPVSASQEHSLRNVRMSVEQAIEVIVQAMGQRSSGVIVEAGIAMAFGCPFEGNVPIDKVVSIAAQLAQAGVSRIGLADTVGYAHPEMIKKVVKAVRREIGASLHSLHLHDTRGLALANMVTALDLDIRCFDSSLGGLGGCPFADGASGNVATEDVVHLLESIGLSTGIDLALLLEARQLLANALPDTPLWGSIARAGVPRTYLKEA
jgi:hydroxymethylglutaryl-CoA lyase